MSAGGICNAMRRHQWRRRRGSNDKEYYMSQQNQPIGAAPQRAPPPERPVGMEFWCRQPVSHTPAAADGRSRSPARPPTSALPSPVAGHWPSFAFGPLPFGFGTLGAARFGGAPRAHAQAASGPVAASAPASQLRRRQGSSSSGLPTTHVCFPPSPP